MKFNVISAIACVSLMSGTAFAQARDTRSEPEENDVDNGPGGTRLAFDLDYVNGLESEANLGTGYGGAVRFGREYDILLLSLTPELMGTLHTFSNPDALQFAGMAGGRATIFKVIEPGVFAHVGAGHVNPSRADSLTGFAFDVGLSLDLTIIPAVDLGVHGAYDSVSWENGTLDWYRVGAHIALAP